MKKNEKKSSFKRAKKVDLSKAEAFISGAEKPQIIKEENEQKPIAEKNPIINEQIVPVESVEKVKNKIAKIKHPWETANEKIIKAVNLRLTEPQHEKLKYISEKTPFSIQKFIMSVLEPAMDKKIKELLKELDK